MLATQFPAARRGDRDVEVSVPEIERWHILEMNGDSYRLASAERKKTASARKPSETEAD